MKTSRARSSSSLRLVECIRLLLRRSRYSPRRLLILGASYALVSSPPVAAVELPVACVGGACGQSADGSNRTFVTSGSAVAAQSGNTLTVKQSTEQATLNWQSFNISADGRVIFSQPSTNSIALNRIFQDSPSKIYGSISTQLNSDASKTGGQIYLVNPNGFVFGAGSSVNAAGILASTLNISDSVFSNGLLSAISSGSVGDPALDSEGHAATELIVEQGATMTTTQANGRILLAAQSITNAGKLTANDGQVILAAGDKVYLSASTDDSLRGLLVEVDAGGTAWNQASGELNAARGDITMVGLAVNQDGRISASTSVSANGSVHLIARDTVVRQGDNSNYYPLGTNGGTVTLGAQSRISVDPQTDDSTTAVDAQDQLMSEVDVFGKQILMKGGANITAHGGNLTMTATADPRTTGTDRNQDASIRIDSGATIDLSGSDATRSVTDNIVSVELRGTELADSPDQRNGALRGQTVTVDARVGTSVADVSGATDGIGKTVAQRLSQGGTATFNSSGNVVVADGAAVDVSGGQTTYTGATVATSQLITADGKLVDIGSAKEDVTYVGVMNPSVSIEHDKWGVVEKIVQATGSHYEEGYIEGASAGTVQFTAPSLIVNGSLVGHALNGVYQRDPTSSSYALGGRLIIGDASDGITDYRTSSVTLQTTSPSVSVADEAGLPLDIPLTLSTAYLTSGGFSRTEIYSNDSVTVATDDTLTLLPTSTLKIRAAQVNIDSSITALAGDIDVAVVNTATNPNGAGGVAVADGVKLDVSGTWINDTEIANAARPSATLTQNAGSISLISPTLDSSLLIGSNVQLLANGGAWLSSSGKLTGGKGGSISLQASGRSGVFDLGSGVDVSAYGVNGSHGGSFTLAAGRIEVTSDSAWAGEQHYDDILAASSDKFFQVGSGLYSDEGFSEINLIASGGSDASQGDALKVDAGVSLNAVVKTLQLANIDRMTGGELTDVGVITTLPDYLRDDPATLTFSVSPYDGYDGSTSLGALAIQQNAVISGDPGATISLANTLGRIDIDGTLRAQGGSISATLLSPGSLSKTTYDSALGIYIGATAILDASGTAVLTPSDSNLLQGQLYDGGTITLEADRGRVSIEHGALIDVSGTATTVDVATGISSAPYSRELVATDAGSISLTASDAIGLYGDIQAHAGVGTSGTAAGGTLSVTLTDANDAALSQAAIEVKQTFPTVDNSIELGNDPLPSTTGVLVSGMASVSAVQVESSGIDDLRLSADDRVIVDAGTTLTLARRLELTAPTLAINTDSSSDAVQLAAPYILIGNSNVAWLGVASSGDGVLKVNADFIDLLGASALANIDQAYLTSNGDIRMRGALSGSSDSGEVGSLTLYGDLTLAAQRVYAATATAYTINANDTLDAATNDVIAQHTVDIEQVGTSSGVPLSAASSLTINAANIEQNGTLLAPFGTIGLNASRSLSLGAGSLTSVSANGTVIPYGSTDSNGGVWDYDGLTAGITTVDEVPTRAIQLTGDSIDIASGATIDVSGGGDLYAYEWVKGTGGTNDALGFKSDANGYQTSVLSNPNLYAIIPSMGSQYAPYDEQQSSVADAQGLQAGDTIYLSGTSGIAAGYYTLLPARYALLPGAYLVTAVSGYNNLQPGTTASLADGTAVVAGYRSFGSTGVGGTSYSGYAIYSGSWARELAEYKDTYASSFFSDASTKTADAGRLSIATGTSLTALGNVNSQAASGGQAATIDVSASNLEIVGTLGEGATGVVQLDDDVLNKWKAGRLLLGGTHSSDGSSIGVAADTVSVAGDAHLSGDEIVLVAKDRVAIDDGGSVRSTSAVNDKAVSLPESTDLTLTGDGADSAAFVAVSDIDNFNLLRDSSSTSTAAGTVAIGSGAQLNTRGSLIVDAPGGATLVGNLGGTGASWSLGSDYLVLGDTSAGGIAITSDLLASMQSASAVHLSSNSSIDFEGYPNGLALTLGSSALSIDNITLSAAAVNDTNNADIALFAKSVVLNGTADSISDAPDTGSGRLDVAAKSITVSGNAMAVSGVSQSNLTAAQQFSVADSGALTVGGDVKIAAPMITAAGASNGAITATGDVHLASTGGSISADGLEIGGALTIAGANIVDDTTILMPSGVVTLTTSNDLQINSGASILAYGTPVVLSTGASADSSGGSIKLTAGDNLSAAAGSILSVAGNGSSDAGSIKVTAGGTADLASTLDGQAADSATGGSFSLNTARVTDFTALNAELQSTGFTNQQSINVAHGDLTLTKGSTTTAHDVQLVTDDGVVTVAGTISAPSSSDRSSIRLYGADGVTITSTGALHADAATSSDNGGIIEVGVSVDTTAHATAAIDFQSGSVVTAAGEELGRMTLRAPAIKHDVSDAALDDIAITALNSDVSQLSRVTLEAVLPEYTSFSSLASAGKTDATNYVDAANTLVQQRLNSANNSSIVLSPGLELDWNSTDDLDLAALNLQTWRFNGTINGDATAANDKTPIALTVRAAGSININGNISDGFITTGTGTNQVTKASDDSSATMRFVAGSNLNSADPLALDSSAINDTGATHDLTLSPGVVVRTGSGDLSLVAAQDVVFAGMTSGNTSNANIAQYSRAYTGGKNASTVQTGTGGVSTSFLDQGGQLLINAGHDVLGYATNESVTAWQSRATCRNSTACATVQTYWGTDIRQFQWNAGTLGGGDLTVTAGNNISQLSAAVAESGREVTVGSDSSITYYNSGALTMSAGNDIESGVIHVGRSTGVVKADNAIVATNTWLDQLNQPLGLFVSMGDSQLELDARSGITLAGMVNATTLPSSISQSARLTYFWTYGDDSSISGNTNAGDVVVQDPYDAIFAFFGYTVAQGQTLSSRVTPASVDLSALTGNITATGSTPLMLYPSDSGELALFAGNDISNVSWMLTDTAESEVTTALKPQSSSGTLALSEIYYSGVNQSPARDSARHTGDLTPVYIDAGRDIVDSRFESAKAIQISAGRDLIDTPIIAQNVNDEDISVISAGRDVLYTDTNMQAISVGGGGQLDVIAGRNVDFGTSEGIETTGNLNNANLKTAGGADVTVMAGMSREWRVDTFIDEIVMKSTAYSQDLIDFMQSLTGASDLTAEQAAEQFKALSGQQQIPFVLKEFFAELVASGKEATSDASKGYTRGYAAIDALLPGSREGNNPYGGDISMLYSRIYTLSGGTINLFAPGGALDVGASAKPLSALLKEPGKLGIVAQQAGDVNIYASGDVSVNSSRIFTLGGGDIAIWSTLGNIDAGKGAKTSLSVPAPTISYDINGNAIVNLSGAVAGSGIRTIQTDSSAKAGDVNLIAPAGFVDAGDAGIGSAGNINIAAQKVIGAENINFAGQASGVPAETSGLAAPLMAASATGAATNNAAPDSINDDKNKKEEQQAPLAQAALSWLEVFVTGLGEDNCKQDDIECLKRQK